MNNIRIKGFSLFKVIIVLLIVISLIASGSYAYWLWSSDINKNVVFNTISGVDKYIVYDEGNSYFVGDFEPTDTFCQNVSNTISFYKKEEVKDINFLATIYMDINSIGKNISLSNDIYWVVTSGSNNISCEDGLDSSTVLTYGTFNGVKSGDTIKLLNNLDVLVTEQEFTIWMWIDNSSEDLSNLSGETIDANIWTEFIMYDEGLPPYEYVVNFDMAGGISDDNLITTYTETGEYTYVFPENGEYKLEAWGAQGGGINGGKGGYTSGIIDMEKGEKIYVYVGGEGPANATQANVGGYNGGGYSGSNSGHQSYGGGGATDIRLVGGVWNDTTSLNSRIMVAGGGAGADSGLSTLAGGGGGLIGGDGTSSNSTYNNATYLPTGATQVGVGFAYQTTARTGGFGYAIQSNTSGWGGGGGGGYYGGGNGIGTTGSGGSSYISGHIGCVAITSESSSSPKSGCTTGTTDSSCSIHYSENIFDNTVMIDGAGYEWTNVRGGLTQMPNPNGGYYESGVGHSGNGVVKIYFLNISQSVVYGGLYEKLPVPNRKGYTFKGWYTEPNGQGTKITENSIVDINGNHTLYAYWSGVVTVSFDVGEVDAEYLTSGEHQYIVPIDGKYKLEVWGAQGGVQVAGGSSTIGYGGYSVGSIELNAGDNLYVNVGGKGLTTTSAGVKINGGYNGGGQGYSYSGDSRGGASGGGATHIATVSGELSTLSQYAGNNNSPILIVAGGGGGSDQCCDGYSKTPGSGGGHIGVSASYDGSVCPGGTQNTGGTFDSDSDGWSGSFGKGADCVTHDCAGGGGGYYGGGAIIGGGGYGSGGSGYIGNSLLTNKAMYCYKCQTSNEADTLTYSTTNNSSTATSNYAKKGNGAAKIILLNSGIDIILGEVYGELPTPFKEGYTFLGWYTEAEGGTLVTSDTVMNTGADHTLYAHWQAN